MPKQKKMKAVGGYVKNIDSNGTMMTTVVNQKANK
jgi:hypothetical protein